MSGDDELRELLMSAAGKPRVTNREALLESLIDRIDAGGEDVADAPLPRPILEAVPGSAARGSRTAAAGVVTKRAMATRTVTRAASIGVAGWVAIGVGAAAAAAAGALLVLQPSVDAPVDVPPSVPASMAPNPHAGFTPTAPSVTMQSPDTLIPSDEDLSDIEVTTPTVPALGGVDLGGVGLDEADLGDAVVDAIAPVVSAIDTSSLTSGGLDLASCSGSAPVVATASDEHGVTGATLRLTTPSGAAASFPMTHTGGGHWRADAGPVTVAALGSVLGSATVTVEAKDAAGNIGVRHTTVPLSAVVCAG